jgi:hypothetical protein
LIFRRMRPTIIGRLLGPMASLVLGLAAAPALAGEWIDGVSNQEGWRRLVCREISTTANSPRF